jgi:predicted ATPase/signal transduction histidine kinase
MLFFPKYQVVEKVFFDVNTVIYRASEENTGKSVIIKILRSLYPSQEELDRLERQYQIARSIDCESIVKAYSLEKYQNGLALILEDFGGQSLREILQLRRISIEEFLQIAIVLAETLEILHQIPIIHKDINPSNIIVNLNTGQVKLTDFGIASCLYIENSTSDNRNILKGTIAYISPEQTGRTNRAIDYRTDFYSLGVTFYEMLTERLPFTSKEPLELIYCHLAEEPVSPQLLNDIPPILSNLTLKLLAKNAEDRYQTAKGLKIDLENCLLQLRTTRKLENFPLGRYDKNHQLSISKKCYGREAEIATLLATIDRVTNVPVGKDRSSVEMVLVSGYSGMGKTFLVKEIQRSIVNMGGYFLTGKFDRPQHNHPYAAFCQAFSEPIRQILTESSQNIAIWREKISLALGKNAQVIVDLIPEVGIILGDISEWQNAEGVESDLSFERIFPKFVALFCQPQQPLVLFLDDLQWADLASSQLYQNLRLDKQLSLLIIGTYRDNDIDAHRTLNETIEAIQKQGIVISQIPLKPLTRENIQQLFLDTIEQKEKTEKTNIVTELIFHKTQGNPFFIYQLITTIYAEKILFYNLAGNEWCWDLEQIKAIGITDDSIVESIVKNIIKLPIETQNLLKLAACLDDRFTLELIATISESSDRDTAINLEKAIAIGSILPCNDRDKFDAIAHQEIIEKKDITLLSSNPKNTVTYKFLDDRLQRAAYSLIPEKEKTATHIKIGRLLLQYFTPERQIEHIFLIVNHLNLGNNLLTISAEKNELARLNLIAARKVKAATDYITTRKYLYLAIAMLNTDSWESDYHLTVTIYLEAAEAEFLNSNYTQLHDRLGGLILEKAKTTLDRVKLYELKIQSYIAENKMQLAIEIGLEVLEMLEVDLEKEPPTITSSVEELIHLPEMTDPLQLATLRILNSLSNVAFVCDYSLLLKVVFAMVNLCVRHGNSALASYTYVYYGVLSCDIAGDVDTGYRFGQLGVSLLDQYPTSKVKARVICIFNSCIRHWKQPLSKTIDPLKESIQLSIESGDFDMTGHAIVNSCSNLFFLGEPLESIERKVSEYIPLLKKFKLQYFLYYAQILQQLSLNLLGRSKNRLVLIGESFNETEMLSILEALNNETSLVYAYLAKGILAYLFKKPELALAHLQEVQKYKQETGTMVVSQYNFYYSLALLAQYPNVPSQERSEFLDRVELNQKELQNWTYQSPANFQHDYELIEAEIARVSGNFDRAVEFYDRAIQTAKKAGYQQKEAIANELAGEFYLSHRQDKIARNYLKDAYCCYQNWGAIAKVRHLEEKYSHFLSDLEDRENIVKKSPFITDSAKSLNTSALDLAAVIRASQVISEEIILDRLLEKLLKILLENSGAQKGFLLLAKNDHLEIVVAASSREKRVTKVRAIPAEKTKLLPHSTIDYVSRTNQCVVLPNPSYQSLFVSDPYYQTNQPKSVLCAPLVKQNKLIGIVYLENNLTYDAFTSDRIEIATLLCTQAAISLENAKLYQDLQQSRAIERAARQMGKALEKEKELNELKSRFISTTSHEFRTPLATIMGSTELLQRYGQKWDEEKKHTHYGRISTAVRRMGNLLEDVLLLGKTDAGKMEFKPLPLNLIQFCQILVQEIILGSDNNKYEIVFCSDSESFEATLDEKLLGHILSNLLTNAVKYSPNGGKIHFYLTGNQKEVIFKIQDRGIGIPVEDREHLFEFFHRSQNVGQIPGTGLGLAIVKKLVDLHGGTIAFDSEINLGSTFTVTIPINSYNNEDSQLKPKP